MSRCSTPRATHRQRDRLTPALRARVDAFPLADRGHGYDALGLSREGVARALRLAMPLYERWFRVESRGVENIPREGAAILAANHSGALPFDALMLTLDVALRSSPPRLARPIEDSFVTHLPFINTLFSRAGAVGGSRGNVEAVLRAGELLLIFPEGVPGISKPFRERYRLQEWRVGHAELAIRHRVPVVPVALVGAEEQMPLLFRIPLPRFVGIPHFPVTLVPFPLPVRYHVLYGEPIALHERYEPASADWPEVVEEASLTVRDAVDRLLQEGLRTRRGVFS